ncbi:MAG: HalD/BesD family halogenase [Acidimicrobiales bacterium]
MTTQSGSIPSGSANKNDTDIDDAGTSANSISSSTGSDHQFKIGYDELARIDAAAAAAQFDHMGYLALPGLLTPSALEGLRNEVARLQAIARRRDFTMECMGGTPRHMTTLGGVEIAKSAPEVSALYGDPELSAALGALVGLELELAADPVERHVLNVLHRSGDTHGLHTDDYPIALVLFLESPTCEAGCGHLEFFDACKAGHTSVRSHAAGDAYILRADKFPHRVQPIHDGCVRTVLNFAYGAKSLPVLTTPSASILYASS